MGGLGWHTETVRGLVLGSSCCPMATVGFGEALGVVCTDVSGLGRDEGGDPLHIRGYAHMGV